MVYYHLQTSSTNMYLSPLLAFLPLIREILPLRVVPSLFINSLTQVFSKESRSLISRACGWKYSSLFQVLTWTCRIWNFDSSCYPLRCSFPLKYIVVRLKGHRSFLRTFNLLSFDRRMINWTAFSRNLSANVETWLRSLRERLGKWPYGCFQLLIVVARM